MSLFYPEGFFIQWYREHGRWFPWRDSQVSPYGMLIAEMMLRQTLAHMVVPVWQAFMSEYPFPAACAGASPAALFKLLAPLGLGQQRAEALQLVSTALLERHNGQVPASIDQLLKLQHVGLYAAHAVACFAYGQRVPVVDVNIIRMFSRLTGTRFPPDNRKAKAVWELATQILPAKHVREHNYGLLDFAAQVCIARRPACGSCLLREHCNFGREAVQGKEG
jgi:A/G-specific adenine glycosylase